MYHYIKPTTKTLEEIEQQIDQSLVQFDSTFWSHVKGKEIALDNSIGLCNTTSRNCIEALKKIEVFAYPCHLPLTAKSPIGDWTTTHYVCIVNIQNELYIYDMPQHEYIVKGKKERTFKYIQNFNPRFIKFSVENIEKEYLVSEVIAKKNFERILSYEMNSLSFQDYYLKTEILKDEEVVN